MHRSVPCLAILLALSAVAPAEQAGAAGMTVPAAKPATAGDVPGSAPALDLTFDPAETALPQGATVAPRPPAPQARAVENPFSVGVKIKNRRDVASPAARATAERPGPPTLTEKMEDIVERAAIGLTGTYRF